MIRSQDKSPEEVVYCCFKFLLENRNEDGTWGKDPREKCSWTAEALFALMELGVPKGSGLIQKGLKHLKGIDRKERFWRLRVPVLLEFGEKGFQEDANELKRCINAKELGDRRLYWEAVYSHILLKYGQKNIDIERVASEVYDRLEEVAKEPVSYKWGDQEELNWTTAGALLLNHFPSKYKKEIQGCINYVLATADAFARRQDIGITAYVIMNLIELGFLEDERVQKLIETAQKVTFIPLEDGGMSEDKRPPGISTGRIYTTALAIRAILESHFHHKPCLFQAISGILLAEMEQMRGKMKEMKLKLDECMQPEKSNWAKFLNRVKKTVRKSIKGFLLGFIVAAISFFLCLHFFGKDIAISLAVGVAAGIITYIIEKATPL